MEFSIHHFHDLFAQLGLPNQPKQIQEFLSTHKLVPAHTRLHEADFWSPAQAAFLREAIEQDSDWSELVDQLSGALRKPEGKHFVGC